MKITVRELKKLVKEALEDELNTIEVGDVVDVDQELMGVLPVRVIELVPDVKKAVGMHPDEKLEPGYENFSGPGFVGEIDPSSGESGHMVFSLDQVMPGSKMKGYFPKLGDEFDEDEYGRPVNNPYRKGAKRHAVASRSRQGDHIPESKSLRQHLGLDEELGAIEHDTPELMAQEIGDACVLVMRRELHENGMRASAADEQQLFDLVFDYCVKTFPKGGMAQEGKSLRQLLGIQEARVAPNVEKILGDLSYDLTVSIGLGGLPDDSDWAQVEMVLGRVPNQSEKEYFVRKWEEATGTGNERADDNDYARWLDDQARIARDEDETEQKRYVPEGKRLIAPYCICGHQHETDMPCDYGDCNCQEFEPQYHADEDRDETKRDAFRGYLPKRNKLPPSEWDDVP